MAWSKLRSGTSESTWHEHAGDISKASKTLWLFVGRPWGCTLSLLMPCAHEWPWVLCTGASNRVKAKWEMLADMHEHIPCKQLCAAGVALVR